MAPPDRRRLCPTAWHGSSQRTSEQGTETVSPHLDTVTTDFWIGLRSALLSRPSRVVSLRTNQRHRVLVDDPPQGGSQRIRPQSGRRPSDRRQPPADAVTGVVAVQPDDDGASARLLPSLTSTTFEEVVAAFRSEPPG